MLAPRVGQVPLHDNQRVPHTATDPLVRALVVLMDATNRKLARDHLHSVAAVEADACEWGDGVGGGDGWVRRRAGFCAAAAVA